MQSRRWNEAYRFKNKRNWIIYCLIGHSVLAVLSAGGGYLLLTKRFGVSSSFSLALAIPALAGILSMLAAAEWLRYEQHYSTKVPVAPRPEDKEGDFVAGLFKWLALISIGGVVLMFSIGELLVKENIATGLGLAVVGVVMFVMSVPHLKRLYEKLLVRKKQVS